MFTETGLSKFTRRKPKSLIIIDYYTTNKLNDHDRSQRFNLKPKGILTKFIKKDILFIYYYKYWPSV